MDQAASGTMRPRVDSPVAICDGAAERKHRPCRTEVL